MSKYLWDFCNVAYEKDSKGKLSTVRYTEVDGVLVVLEGNKLSSGDQCKQYSKPICWDKKNRQSLVSITTTTIKDRDIRDFILHHEIAHIKLRHDLGKLDNVNSWSVRQSFVDSGRVPLEELQADAYTCNSIGFDKSIRALEKLLTGSINRLIRAVDKPFMLRSRVKQLRLVCKEFELRIKYLKNLY